MRPLPIAIALSLLCLVACGGGGGDAGSADGVDDIGAAAAEGTGPGQLPEGFPPDLVPPGHDGGQVAALGGIVTVTFEGGLTFEEAVAHYTDVRGEPVVVGEPGSRLANWTQGPDWVIAVFEEDGPLVTVTSIP